MNVLDSRCEALAFNYAQIGFFTAVNNLWAWIAVVTATVSLWRLRASTTTHRIPNSPDTNADPNQTVEILDADPNQTVEMLSCVSAGQTSVTESTNTVVDLVYSASYIEDDGGGMRKKAEKFTMYYGEKEEENESKLTADEECDDVRFDGMWVDKEFEKVVRLRMGDMGWYRYQDTAVIYGNVVRLWDGCRTRKPRLEE